MWYGVSKSAKYRCITAGARKDILSLDPLTWRYCYLNKRKCNLSQSEDYSFVEKVGMNNN